MSIPQHKLKYRQTHAPSKGLKAFHVTGNKKSCLDFLMFKLTKKIVHTSKTTLEYR